MRRAGSAVNESPRVFLMTKMEPTRAQPNGLNESPANNPIKKAGLVRARL
jgi:hypothetical protein